MTGFSSIYVADSEVRLGGRRGQTMPTLFTVLRSLDLILRTMRALKDFNQTREISLNFKDFTKFPATKTDSCKIINYSHNFPLLCLPPLPPKGQGPLQKHAPLLQPLAPPRGVLHIYYLINFLLILPAASPPLSSTPS